MKDGKKSISTKAQLQFKELIRRAKDEKLIKPHTEAFYDVPVSGEKHQGKKQYFLK